MIWIYWFLSLTKHKGSCAGTKWFKCDLCDKGFIKNKQLVWKGFSKSGSLTKHKLTQSEANPFECDFCDKRFTQSENLHTHN